MKKLNYTLKRGVLLLSLSLFTTASFAGNDDSTFTVRLTKTVDGKTSVKEEFVTLKQGEDIDDIVKKMEKDWTREDLKSGKKIKVNVEVKSKNASDKDMKETRKERSEKRIREKREIREEQSDGKKEVIKEKKVIIKKVE